MATPDHTALVRPPNPFGGTFTSTPGSPPCSAGTVEPLSQSTGSHACRISMAMLAIQTLAVDSDAKPCALASGLLVEPYGQPWASVVADGPSAAFHSLKPNAGALGHEPRVNL
jgi:hypothetical protein